MDEERQLTAGQGWSAAEKILIWLTFGCLALTAAVISCSSLSRLIDETAPWPFVVVYLVLPAVLIAALMALCRRAEAGTARRFGALLFLSALALKGSFAAWMATEPVSDFGMLYAVAGALARGSAKLTDYEYFVWWPYQSGFVAWMAAFIRLFGADVLFFKLTNALFSALTNLLVYGFARRFASERGARAAALLYLLYPGTWLLVPVLTNQHLSELLFAAAIYIYTAPAESLRKKLGLAAAAGVLLTLGNAVRPIAVVALAAAACAMVLELLQRRQKGWAGARDALLRAVVLALFYTVLMAGLSGLARITGLNEYGLGNNCPEWKFVLGLNEQTKGGYSRSDAEAVFGGEDPRQAARDLLAARLPIPPGRLLELFRWKIYKMWGSFEEMVWIMTGSAVSQLEGLGLPVPVQKLENAVRRFSCGFYALVFLLAAAGGIAAARGKGRREPTTQMLALSALAYFGALLLTEVQARYRSLMLILIFPLAALGMDILWTLWENRKTRPAGINT